MKAGLRQVALVMICICSGVAHAEYSDETFCKLTEFELPLRQTHIVIDGAMVTHENEGPLAENKVWRQKVIAFLDAQDASILRRLAPRERISVSIAQTDGSGLQKLFAGCAPLYAAGEQQALAQNESSLAIFFGKGWRDQLGKQIDHFRRTLTLALVEGAKHNNSNKNKAEPFVESGLGQSLARGYSASLDYGIPRIVILSNLSKYHFAKDQADVKSARALARSQTTQWGADFNKAEVHILGASETQKARDKEYLKSLFLGAKGELVTLASLTGSLKEESVPTSVDIYRGTVSYPDGDFPTLMRVALDANKRSVNSWIEVQSDQIRFLPFDGGLTCTGENECTFIATGGFAQIWTDEPGGDPEFENWMPFVGFRNMTLTFEGDQVSGMITDSSGYVPGMEDGLPMKLQRVDGGAF